MFKKINGDQAQYTLRMRYQDPEGDYGRQKREVIKKLFERFSVLNSDESLPGHFERQVSSNMQTNIELTSEYTSAFRLQGCSDN